jgi:hypothetical protein
MNHMNNVKVDTLIEEGTMHIDFNNSVHVREFSCEFFCDQTLYIDGIRENWESLVVLYPDYEKADLHFLLYHIIYNQLFRLPVSWLGNLDAGAFMSDAEFDSEEMKTRMQWQNIIIELTARHRFIEKVNNMYEKAFSDLITKLRARQRSLKLMKTRLNYALDPTVKSSDDLEKRYIEFLHEQENSDYHKPNVALLPIEVLVKTEEVKSRSEIFGQIHSLYKMIAKNCREVHANVDGDSKYESLHACFLEANETYDMTLNLLGYLLLKQGVLLLLLVRTINNRKLLLLPDEPTDYTVVLKELPFKLSDDEIMDVERRMRGFIAAEENIFGTELKMKYIGDEEIAGIHRGHLMREIGELEDRILEVTNEIESVMEKKKNSN